jgi:hypothetical protein
VNWTLNPTRVFPFVPDFVNFAIYDPATRKYLNYVRLWQPEEKWRKGVKWRRVGVVETDDVMKPWPYNKDTTRWMPWESGQMGPPTPNEVPIAFSADAEDPKLVDHYLAATVKYAWADDAFLMFPSAYRRYATMHYDGPLDIQLAVSRNGRKFQRISRSPYVELGLKGEKDSGSLYMYIGLLKVRSELFHYYGTIDFTHGEYLKLPQIRNHGGVRLLRQRLDGFVSVDADERGGEFVTSAVKFQGRQLRLNMNASATGEIFVELRDSDGRPIAGHTFDDSDSLGQNDLAKVVTWKGGNKDIGSLAGRPVRIAFKLRAAKLYAFQFTN